LWNKSAQKMFGFRPSQAIGRNIYGLIFPPQDINAPTAGLGDLSDIYNHKIASKTIETNAIHKSGQQFPVEISFSRIKKDHDCSVVAIIRDITKRKKNLEMLKVRQQHLKGVLESTDNGILVIGKDGEVLSKNRQFVKMWKIPSRLLKKCQEGQMLEYACSQLQDPQAFLKKIKKLYDSDASSIDHILLKDGKIFERYSSPLLIEKKNEGRIWSFRDITVLKKAEKSLMEREKYLATMLNSIGDAVIATDLSARIIRMNAVAEKLTGWKFSEARGHKIYDIFHIINAKTREIAKDPIKHVLQTGRTVGLANHTALLSRDGKEYQIADSAAPIKDAKGEILGVVIVFHDVSKQYHLQEEVRKNEERFEQIAEQSREIVWEVDQYGLYKFISKASKAVIGYKPEELIGKMHFYDLHPEEDREEFKREAFAIFQKKKIFVEVKNQVLTKDGRIVWFSTNGAPIFDEEGNLEGYRGSDHDITESIHNTKALKYHLRIEKTLYRDRLFVY
jgi:PAS domain S-box-containing protein